MLLSRFLNSMSIATQMPYVTELLSLNERTMAYNLQLTPRDIQDLMTARTQVLYSYGRVELGIEATKELIEVFSTSPYICQENYLSTLNELHEIFYYLKNETEDKIGDFKLIAMMKEYFDDECAGSLKLLRNNLEEFAENFRIQTMRQEYLKEGDDES
ncbi:DUF6323 family protein [Alicyclobacillus shizuokensis]|uniref:DUF6323 family protein n=1 Tax=Alicyclobacillus shizuokensis TaxID=392014 RepID=UPI00082D5421|nr:DUF6323 family protein [Alicyclobacillus shizuokensis]MCL6625090.1 DUF6323 family protein [Alicyclobacillus shizuokensis]